MTSEPKIYGKIKFIAILVLTLAAMTTYAQAQQLSLCNTICIFDDTTVTTSTKYFRCQVCYGGAPRDSYCRTGKLSEFKYPRGEDACFSSSQLNKVTGIICYLIGGGDPNGIPYRISDLLGPYCAYAIVGSNEKDGALHIKPR